MTELSKWGKDCRWAYGNLRCRATDLLVLPDFFNRDLGVNSCRAGATPTSISGPRVFIVPSGNLTLLLLWKITFFNRKTY